MTRTVRESTGIKLGVIALYVLLPVCPTAVDAQPAEFPFDYSVEEGSAGSEYKVGTVGGKGFEVYSDMSGHVGWWDLRGCEVDAMTDEKTCWIINGNTHHGGDSDGPLVLAYGPEGLKSISLWGDLCPGSRQYIRIDETEPETRPAERPWTGDAARSLLSRLKKADRIRTRRYEWPDCDNALDRETPPLKGGFKEAVTIVMWWIDGGEVN